MEVMADPLEGIKPILYATVNYGLHNKPLLVAAQRVCVLLGDFLVAAEEARHILGLMAKLPLLGAVQRSLYSLQLLLQSYDTEWDRFGEKLSAIVRYQCLGTVLHLPER